MAKYSFTLLDEYLEVIEACNIPDGDDLETAKQQAVDYLREHPIPVATLTIEDAKTFEPAMDSIDILYNPENDKAAFVNPLTGEEL